MRRRTESRARRRQTTRMQTELHRPTQCWYEPTTISGNTNTSFAPLLEIKSPHKQTRPSIMVSSRATGGRAARSTTAPLPPRGNARHHGMPLPRKFRHLRRNQTKFGSLPAGIEKSFTPRRVPTAQLEIGRTPTPRAKARQSQLRTNALERGIYASSSARPVLSIISTHY